MKVSVSAGLDLRTCEIVRRAKLPSLVGAQRGIFRSALPINTELVCRRAHELVSDAVLPVAIHSGGSVSLSAGDQILKYGSHSTRGTDGGPLLGLKLKRK